MILWVSPYYTEADRALEGRQTPAFEEGKYDPYYRRQELIRYDVSIDYSILTKKKKTHQRGKAQDAAEPWYH